MHRSLPRTGAVVGSTVATLAVASLVLAGCATTAATQPSPSPSASPSSSQPAASDATELGTVPEPLPTGEVLGQGLVLDAGTPILCLGDVGATLPPTCGGEPLAGWDWSGVDGWEERGAVRWGSYAVQGTWDGDTFAVTGDPVPLALHDPAPIVPPTPTAGTTSPDELARIQQVLVEALGDRLLSVGMGDGMLEARVVFDDGTLQEHVDGVYGAGVVLVTSALQPVS